jgi:hypothetical protein
LDIFSLGSFDKITEIAQSFGQLFSTAKDMYRFGQRMDLDTFWAIFFTNSSGHPAKRQLAKGPFLH